MSRVRKNTPGRILFVGSGPGDPGPAHRSRTRRAHGRQPWPSPTPMSTRASSRSSGTDHGHATRRRGSLSPRCGPPWVSPPRSPRHSSHEAKDGHDVVRLVSGDPLTTDSVIAEVNAVARTQVSVRGPAGPARRIGGAELRGHGAGLGSHRGRRARRGRLGRAGRGSGTAGPARDLGASRRDRERAGRERHWRRRLPPRSPCAAPRVSSAPSRRPWRRSTRRAPNWSARWS